MAKHTTDIFNKIWILNEWIKYKKTSKMLIFGS